MIRTVRIPIVMILFFTSLLPSPQVIQAQHKTYRETLQLGKGVILHTIWNSDDSAFLIESSSSLRLYTADLKEKAVLTIEATPLFGDYPEGVWTPDGHQIIYTEGDKKSLKVWNTALSHAERTLETLTNKVKYGDIELSPDGKSLVVSYTDNSVKVWDIQTGQVSKIYTKVSTSISEMKWQSDSQAIALIVDAAVLIWDLQSNQIKYRLPQATEISWSPNNRFLAIGGAAGQLSVYDTSIGQVTGTYTSSDITLDKLMWSPDGTKIAFAAHNLQAPSSSITVLNADNLQVLWKHTADTWDGGYDNFQWSPDGKHIIVKAPTAESVDTLDIENGTTQASFPLPKKKNYWKVSLSVEGTKLLLVDASNTLYLYDLKANKPVESAQNGFGSDYSWISFSPNGKTIAAGGDNESIFLWDVKTGQLLKTLSVPNPPIFMSKSIEAVWSPDGNYIAGIVGDIHPDPTVLYIWDVNSGNASQLSTTMNAENDSTIPDNGYFYGVSWHPSGKSLALFQGGRTIRLLSFPNKKIIWFIQPYQVDFVEFGCNVAWNSDGSQFVCIGGDTSGVFDGMTGKHVLNLAIEHTYFYGYSAWTSDNNDIFYAPGDGGVLDILNAQTGKLLETRNISLPFFAISSDNYLAYITNPDYKLVVENFKSKQRLATLPVDGNNISNFAWSPDGQQLAVIDGDAIRIFQQ